MEFTTIKSNEGYYFVMPRGGLLFDGKKAEPTFCSGWFFIPKLPEKVVEVIKQPDINCRYELKDKEFESEKIPLVISKETICKMSEEDRENWFAGLGTLYAFKSDSQEDLFKEIKFSFNIKYEVESVVPPADIKYDVRYTEWKSKGTVPFSVSNLESCIMDKIIFPSILLPQRPCKLKSKDLYRIIREFVRTNINPKYARVSSDYDFCFSVEKVIPLLYPDEYTVNVNASFPKRKPKYEKRYRVNRSITCFEMTSNIDKYRNYTVIDDMYGENQEDLKNKLDTYLKELIDRINEPVVDCPHCKGQGVVLSSTEENK